MTVQDSNHTMQELDFLMSRYTQLIERLNSINEIIHTTFYISIVVFGATVGVVPELEIFEIRAALYVFVSIIFSSMFFWTKTYINGRNEVVDNMNKVIRELQGYESGFGNIEPVERFFPEVPDHRVDSWEKAGRKERVLLGYYLTLAAVSIVSLLIDLLINIA